MNPVASRLAPHDAASHPRAAPAPERAFGVAERALAGLRTPMTGKVAEALLGAAYRSERGSAPREETLDLLWAQWALETGHGRSMHGYNFGGLKGRADGSAVLKTRERVGASVVEIRDGFRTYRSADAGARDYVRTLAERFPSALSAAERGDGAGFVTALADARYFTARRETYHKAIERLASVRAGAGQPGPGERRAPALLLERLMEGLARLLARRSFDGAA
ncbi:MAG TPA: glucosaminidase domain-containing protein [Polyangiaceae bacterium]|jgi:hypothetical protein